MRLFKIMPIAALVATVLSVSGTYQARANVADDLNANYNKIVDNCGSVNRPAFLCSGNLIRFTSTSKSYHTWDPSPNSIRMGAVSFMYLRKDISVKLVFEGQTSGIIYYPSMLKPSWKGRAEISCAFPTDGWTGGRPDGCGRIDNNQRCQDMGIYTAADWYKNYKSMSDVNGYRSQYQCSFDMRVGVQNTAAVFNENLKATHMNPNSFYDYNEIIIKAWPTNTQGQITNPEQLPIQAFFYTIQGTNSGLVDAQYFQQDYYNVTGIWVPIVKADANDPNNIYFGYSAKEQVVAGCSQ